MIRRDILLDMTQEIARFIALLLGLLKKEDTVIVEQQLNQFLLTHFLLTPNFTFEEVENLYKNEKLTINDLKGIAQLLLLQGEMQVPITKKDAFLTFSKAAKIIEFIFENTNIFDLNLHQQQRNVNAFLKDLAPNSSQNPLVE